LPDEKPQLEMDFFDLCFTDASFIWLAEKADEYQKDNNKLAAVVAAIKAMAR